MWGVSECTEEGPQIKMFHFLMENMSPEVIYMFYVNKKKYITVRDR
jgi:hypothetical protein